MVFRDLSNRHASLDAKKDPLVEIDVVVTWEELRWLLSGSGASRIRIASPGPGARPIDAVLMFKTLALSALYNLSDDQIEYQVRDRLSFTRFLGLGLKDLCARRQDGMALSRRTGAGRQNRRTVYVV